MWVELYQHDAMSTKPLRILAISGSLRDNASSSRVLKYVGSILGPSCEVEFYDGISRLPHFNDSKMIHAEVDELRNKISYSDGVIISQPEYAFGVAGSLKNALDWTVGSGEFSGKPVALITAATGGENAHEAMLKTLRAIDCQLSEETCLLIPFIKSKLDQQGNIKDADLQMQLQNFVHDFISKLTPHTVPGR